MLSRIIRAYQSMRCKRIAAAIAPHLRRGDQVLDFGCGSLRIARELHDGFGVSVVGIDILDMGSKREKGIPFSIFDGRHLPFADKSFDVTYVAFVLHHTTNAEELLDECLRVTRRTLLLLEDVYTNSVDLLLTKVMDMGNLLNHDSMALPFTFRREEEWKQILLERGCASVRVERIVPVPLRPVRNRFLVASLR